MKTSLSLPAIPKNPAQTWDSGHPRFLQSGVSPGQKQSFPVTSSMAQVINSYIYGVRRHSLISHADHELLVTSIRKRHDAEGRLRSAFVNSNSFNSCTTHRSLSGVATNWWSSTPMAGAAREGFEPETFRSSRRSDD